MERRTLGGREVDDVAVGLEHVDLLDGLDGLSVQLLQSGLQLLVVIGAASDIPSLLLSGGTLAACDDRKPVNRSMFFLNQFERRLTHTHSRWFWTGAAGAQSNEWAQDIPVRAGAAPPNFFFRISCTSAMSAVDVWWAGEL